MLMDLEKHVANVSGDGFATCVLERLSLVTISVSPDAQLQMVANGNKWHCETV